MNKISRTVTEWTCVLSNFLRGKSGVSHFRRKSEEESMCGVPHCWDGTSGEVEAGLQCQTPGLWWKSSVKVCTPERIFWSRFDRSISLCHSDLHGVCGNALLPVAMVKLLTRAKITQLTRQGEWVQRTGFAWRGPRRCTPSPLCSVLRWKLE